ncbi:serine protease 1-like [Lycorma delicatula]|uniref:serine protease 1-like n=1 Tax=Lycorma delicatula TaxID=130591 RepID=UPI003F50EA46
MYIFVCFIRIGGEWLNNGVSKKTRIVGGKTAEYGEFPYFVSIQRLVITEYDVGYSHFCGGGILSKYAILTAGQCCFVTIFYGSNIVIVGGTINLNDERILRIAAKECEIHPNYKNSTRENDIALIFLKNAIDFYSWPNIQPALYSTDPIKVGQKCSIMGFGAIDESSETYPTELKTVMQTVDTQQVCESAFNIHQTYNIEAMFCAGEDSGKSGCVGDSGSPFVCSDIIYGVAVYGFSKCGTGPTAYINIAFYNDWIKNTIATKSGKSAGPISPREIQFELKGSNNSQY